MKNLKVDPMFNEDPEERPTSVKKALGIVVLIVAIGAIGMLIINFIPHKSVSSSPTPATQFK